MSGKNNQNETNVQAYAAYSPELKLRDIEEKYRLLKDRTLLIGENLIQSKEETAKEISILRIDVEKIKQDVERIKDILQRISEELDEKARKEEITILQNQAKMFKPLELATIDDVEKMLNERRIDSKAKNLNSDEQIE